MADFFCTVAVNIAQETGAAVLLPHHTVKGFAKGKGKQV
jgi:RecA-family ATPase